MTIVFVFLHHLAAFTLVGALAIEFLLIHQKLKPSTMRRLIAVDAVLGTSSATLLVLGVLRIFEFGRSSDHYLASRAFTVKLGVFLGIVMLSLIPTMEFLSWRKALRQGRMPAVAEEQWRMVQATIHGEMTGIVAILLCAAIMGRGSA